MHCLDGRRITSLVLLNLRRIQQYNVQWSFGEFWRYQQIGRIPIPLQDIERASKEIEKYVSALDFSELVLPQVIPSWICNGNRSMCLSSIRSMSKGSNTSSTNLSATSTSQDVLVLAATAIPLQTQKSLELLPIPAFTTNSSTTGRICTVYCMYVDMT
jgi:hypothetical protein